MEENKSSLKIPKIIYDHRYFILTVVFIVALCFIPLDLMATTKGHDYGFHFQRIHALAEEIDMGNYFPRIYSTMLGGNGYGTPLFYGDLFVMIPALLVAWGNFSVPDAYAFFVALVFCATTLSMYFCTVSFAKSKKAGFCGAVMYGLSSYLVTDLIQRGALGEGQAFIFIPITFLGFYHIMYDDLKKWYLLPIGLAGMIYCHLLSSIVTVFVLAVFLAVSFKKIKENPKRLIFIAISAIVFFLLSANYIFPMLEQLRSNEFLSTDGFSATKWGTLEGRSMPWWAVFYDFASSSDIHHTYIPNGIGLAGLVFAGIFIFCGKKPRNKLVTFLLIVSAVILFMTTSLFPWPVFQNVAGILQFPWRLLVYPTFFIAAAAALYFGDESHSNDHSNLMYVVIALSLCSYVCCGSGYFNTYAKYKAEDVNVKYDYINKIGAAEYLPSCEDFKSLKNYDAVYKEALISSANKLYSDGKPKASFTREDGKLIVEFSGMVKDNAYIDVPLLMYKGYSAHLEDGTELECNYGKYNRIRVNVGNVREGKITFEYTGTATQKISGVVSVVSLIAMIAYLAVMPRLLKNSKRKTPINSSPTDDSDNKTEEIPEI